MADDAVVDLFFRPDGTVEVLDAPAAAALIAPLGAASRRRAAHVVPRHPLPRLAFAALRAAAGDDGRAAAWTRRWPCAWRADLRPSGGPTLGPFATRDDAAAAERGWLEAHRYPRG